VELQFSALTGQSESASVHTVYACDLIQVKQSAGISEGVRLVLSACLGLPGRMGVATASHYSDEISRV
jgi:hypothetical protein